jgi:CheY-like chemotaxis protein
VGIPEIGPLLLTRVTRREVNGSEAQNPEERGFSASLAERVTVLRRAIHALRETGGAQAMRARVQRRLHSLGAAARTVGFFRMAIRICDAQSVLEATDVVTAADLAALDGLLDELPLLMTKEALPPLGLPRLDGTEEIAVCVLGDHALEELLRPAHGASTAFAAARFDDPSQVWAALHPVVPDVFVIDVDVPGARAFVAALIDDLRTELVPIVAVGRFETRDLVAHYVALGVTRTFTKPAQGAALRAACTDAVEQRRGHTIRVALRGGTLPPPPVRRGAEPAATADAATASTPAPSVPLTLPTTFVGRRVVVGDDDPVVVWFLADHFRKLGCHVDEALSGQATLARALDVEREVPDLVFADLAMRDLDGDALVRALRADPATRDVPVVLQSWKQDRLDEARAAGVDASLLAKSATPEEHAAKAVEVLGPHAHLRARLRAGGALHGALDKVSVLRLLTLAQETPRTLKITVKDDSFVHALTVMAGSLRKVTRTAPGGRTVDGARAIATALGVARGTFTIEDTAAVDGGPCGAGFVTDAVRAARALADAVRGAHLPNVAEVRFDEDIETATRVFEGQDAELARRLGAGAAPRALLHDGEVDAGRLEAVLVALCRQGFVTAVREESPLLAAGPLPRPVSPAPDWAPEPTPSPPPAPPTLETTLPLLLQRQRAILLAPPAIVVDIPLPAPVPVHTAAPIPVPVRAPAPVPAAPAPAAQPLPEITDVDQTRYAALPEPSMSVPITFEDPQFSRPIACLEPPPAPAPSPEAFSPPPPPAPPLAPAPAPATLSAPIAPRAPLTLSPPPSLAGPTVLSLPLAFQERAPRTNEAFDFPLPFMHHHRDGDSPPPTSVTARPPGPGRRWQRAAIVSAIAGVAVFAGAAVRWTAAAIPSRSAASEAKPARPISAPQGLLEVSAADGIAIQVDGTPRGMGPKLSVSLSEGMHEVHTDGPNAKTRLVEIARGKVTHVDLAWKPAPVPPTR